MRIGILTSKVISEINLKVLDMILEDKNFQISLAIIDCRPKLSFRKKISKNLKRGRGGYILIMFFKKLFSGNGKVYKTIEICKLKGIDIIETISPYSSETISKIEKHKLDILLLINGFGILKEELLKITPLGVLSYHHGNMRKYRGMPPAFWELYNNEKEIGVTVQRLGSGLDSGIPVEEKTLLINEKDTLNSLTERMYCEGINMMYNALIKLSDPDFRPDKIDFYGKVHTLPNFRQWLVFKMKMIVRQVNKS